MPRPFAAAPIRPSVQHRSTSAGRSARPLFSGTSSRSPSPGNPGRRITKLNLYLQRLAANTAEQLERGSIAGSNTRITSIKRWDGNQRTTTNWDGLRRDPELWFPNGDCLIHLYERGHSRRGASMRLSLAAIESSNCRPLLEQCSAQPVPEDPQQNRMSIASSVGDSFMDASNPAKYELYIPAPAHLSREEAFRYHLTTRNFFAWMFEKPMVGDRLGDALVALLTRMNEFRPDEEENQDDVLAYLDSQEYTDFRNCPDHALAILQFSEKFEYRELWTDAFVHCAGMNDDLAKSAEFEFVSRTSKALITRAHLEMQLRLEHAGKSLGNFLEEHVSGACLGLGNDAQIHLERFRSFLHSYYVGKYGYWPPPETTENSFALPKVTYRSMYFEFRRLYEYLVDPESTTSMHDNRPADGGICVLQNIQSFDRRRRYTSLPHPLPLVPDLPEDMSHPRSNGISKLFGNRQAKLERRATALAALSAATNPGDLRVMECGLVREYLRFEKSWTMKEEEAVSCADARKVRWILIYAILQTLISVTRAPKEVRDTEGVSYPLCCQIAGTPPWEYGEKGLKVTAKAPTVELEKARKIIEIRPDADYSALKPKPLSPKKIHRASSLPIALPRKVSIGQDLALDAPQPVKSGFCEILVQGYGNGMNNSESDSVHSDPSTPSTSTGGADSSGWSTSSSEDDMEHGSVSGGVSLSCYGDDEADFDLDPSSEDSLTPTKKASVGSFNPDKFNPEVELYVWS